MQSCKYTPQLTRTQNQAANYSKWLSHVRCRPVANDSVALNYFLTQLKAAGYKGRLKYANAEVLMYMNATKNKPDSYLINLISSICDTGFFERTFHMDNTSMFYRFEKPDSMGIGMAYISDRYPFGYLDAQTTLSKDYIPNLSYVFPRVYFIREKTISILSGDIDLTDRKDFVQISDTNIAFEKVCTHRKDNNDVVYDQIYHFRYSSYNATANNWKNQLNDTTPGDVVDFTEFAVLNEIVKKHGEMYLSDIVDTNSAVHKDQWFFAGTLNEFGQWEQNYLSFEDTAQIQTKITKDETIICGTKLYLRSNAPNADLKINKGKIIGSIKAGEEITLLDKKIIHTGITSYVWLKKNPQ